MAGKSEAEPKFSGDEDETGLGMVFTRRATMAVAITAILLVQPNSAVAERQPALRLVQRFPYKGGLEVATSGRFVYASQWDGHYNRAEKPKWGGVRIYDVSGTKARAVGMLQCPGYDNDVAALGSGLIALGYGENMCASRPTVPGILVADVSDPSNPRVLGDVPVTYAHTISVYPGKPLVYASTGGWLPVGNDGRIDIVNVADPSHPRVVGHFVFEGYGCHDITFRITRTDKLAFCTTASPLQLILDVSKPTKPQIVGRIVNPLIQYGHTAMASPDGKILAITDEAFVAHECVSGSSVEGGLWLYDISDPATPLLLGYRAPHAGRAPVGDIVDWTASYCTAAMLDWIPNSRHLIVSWYSGGIEILDLSDPLSPQQLAMYNPSDGLAYGVKYLHGKVYLNDIDRGFEVLEFRDAA